MRDRWRSMWLYESLILVAGLALGVIARAADEPLCRSLPSEAFGRPVAGTPRAAYCNAVEHWYAWPAFGLAGLLMLFVCSYALRRFGSARAWSLALVTAAVVIQVLVVGELADHPSI